MIKTKRDDPRADIQLIGAAIYSQWRYVNHWSDESPSEKDREWFIYMLGWLEERSCNIIMGNPEIIEVDSETLL